MSGPQNHVLIDANIARSATDPARHPVTVACLRLARLLESRDCDTGVALTSTLHDEWKLHASGMMSSWLTRMELRGRVRREKDRRVSDLRQAVDRETDPGVRAALLKDVHISEAAILHGIPVASRDDRQRGYLKLVSADYDLAGRVQWFNPISDEEWEGWVRGGCIDRSVFQCGCI